MGAKLVMPDNVWMKPDTLPAPLPQSNHMRLAHQGCHPEPFDFAQDKLRAGACGQILRCAQNDDAERSQHKVYECRGV